VGRPRLHHGLCTKPITKPPKGDQLAPIAIALAAARGDTYAVIPNGPQILSRVSLTWNPATCFRSLLVV